MQHIHFSNCTCTPVRRVQHCGIFPQFAPSKSHEASEFKGPCGQDTCGSLETRLGWICWIPSLKSLGERADRGKRKDFESF